MRGHDSGSESADAILILGAAVWADGPSPTLRRRTLYAAKLWHAGNASHIVACGGMGKHGPTEAAAMQCLLVDAGVPVDRVVQEDQSTNTLENLQFAAPILRQLAASRIIIVTDLTHAPRTAMVAHHIGINARVSCPSWRGARKRTVFRQALREAGAIPLYAWRLWLAQTGPDDSHNQRN